MKSEEFERISACRYRFIVPSKISPCCAEKIFLLLKIKFPAAEK